MGKPGRDGVGGGWPSFWGNGAGLVCARRIGRGLSWRRVGILFPVSGPGEEARAFLRTNVTSVSLPAPLQGEAYEDFKEDEQDPPTPDLTLAPAGDEQAVGSVTACEMARQLVDLDVLLEQTKAMADPRVHHAVLTTRRDAERAALVVTQEDAGLMNELARLRQEDARTLAAAREARAQERAVAQARQAAQARLRAATEDMAKKRVEFMWERREQAAAHALHRVETTYTAESLGAGLPGGGGDGFRQARWRVLQQIWQLMPASDSPRHVTLTANLKFDFGRWDDIGTGPRVRSFGRSWGQTVRNTFQKMVERAGAGDFVGCREVWGRIVDGLPKRGGRDALVIPARPGA